MISYHFRCQGEISALHKGVEHRKKKTKMAFYDSAVAMNLLFPIFLKNHNDKFT